MMRIAVLTITSMIVIFLIIVNDTVPCHATMWYSDIDLKYLLQGRMMQIHRAKKWNKSTVLSASGALIA